MTTYRVELSAVFKYSSEDFDDLTRDRAEHMATYHIMHEPELLDKTVVVEED